MLIIASIVRRLRIFAPLAPSPTVFSRTDPAYHVVILTVSIVRIQTFAPPVLNPIVFSQMGVACPAIKLIVSFVKTQSETSVRFVCNFIVRILGLASPAT